MKIQAFLRESPLIAVVWTARRFELQLSQLFRDKELNLSAALVLVSIFFEEPGRVSPSQLADVLSMTRGNVSHAISSLEAQGLLTRRLDPNDARAFQLFLKPQGKRMAMQVVRILHQMQSSFEKTIGVAQLTTFLDVIGRIEQISRHIPPAKQ